MNFCEHTIHHTPFAPMHQHTPFSCNYHSLTPPPPPPPPPPPTPKTMCSPSWHCLIGRHELLPLTFTLLIYMFHSHTLSFFFISVYTVNLSLLCNHYLSLSQKEIKKGESPFFISFCERHLVFSYFFFVLVVPLMCVS